MMLLMIVTAPAILSFFTIFSFKNFSFSGGEDGDPSEGSDIELCEGVNRPDAETWCEIGDPSDVDAYDVDFDSSASDDDRCCEGVNLSGGESSSSLPCHDAGPDITVAGSLGYPELGV